MLRTPAPLIGALGVTKKQSERAYFKANRVAVGGEMGKRRNAGLVGQTARHLSGGRTIERARCPCCGYRTLHGRANDDICAVCFWQDDGQGDENADEVWGGPNRDISLTEARANYRTFGASHKDCIPHVRAPLQNEF